MRFRYTAEALQDLSEAMAYIAADNPDAAEATRARIERALERLLRFPESGRFVPELQDGVTREVVVPPYRVFYHVGREFVTIISVWHGAQDVAGGEERED